MGKGRALAAWRAYQLTAPFVAVAAAFTSCAIVATQWQGPWLGAVLAGIGCLGSVLSSATSKKLRPHGERLGSRSGIGLTTAWAASQGLSVAALLLRWPLWACMGLALTSGLLLGWASVYRRQAVAHWGGRWLRLAGPTGRVGATIGALAGSAIAISGNWAFLAILLVLPLSSPISFHATRDTPAASSPSRRVFAVNMTFAALAVGPVAAMPSLVTATIGAEWVGPAMGVYALGALASPMLLRAAPQLTPTGLRGYLAAGVIANAAWLLTAVVPIAGLLACRAIGGVTLFAAEGSADIEAARTDSFGASLAGRSLGAGVGGILTGALLGVTGSVLATTSIFAAAGVAATGMLLVSERRRSTSSLVPS